MVQAITRQKLVLGQEIMGLRLIRSDYSVQFFWHKGSKTFFRVVWMGTATHIQRQTTDDNNCVCWVLVADDMWT